MKVQAKEFFYLSNQLSIARILIAFPIAYYIQLNTPEGNIILLILSFIGALTDMLDGYFSRKFNQVTDLGIVLDPIADKIAMAIILGSLLYFREFSIPLTIFLIYRDLLIMGIGTLTVNKTETPAMANKYGKFNTCLIALTAILYMAGVTGSVYKGLVVACYISIFVSGFSYMKVAETLLFNEKKHKTYFRAGVVLLTAAVIYTTGLFYDFI